jgi:large-conductance mechanosensitive channel
MFDLEKTGLSFEEFKNQFKNFIINNSLVGTAAGVTVGITTKELIDSLVKDIIIPSMYLVISFFGIRKLEILEGKNQFDTTSFTRHFITWVLSIIAIFFFIYYFFMSVVGINNESLPPHHHPITSTTTNSENQNIKKTNDYQKQN